MPDLLCNKKLDEHLQMQEEIQHTSPEVYGQSRMQLMVISSKIEYVGGGTWAQWYLRQIKCNKLN